MYEVKKANSKYVTLNWYCENTIWPNQAVRDGPDHVTWRRKIRRIGVSINLRRSKPSWDAKVEFLEKPLAPVKSIRLGSR